ncbi:MAG TPA: VOC family protein [Acidimicrobiales bacterium]|nr:VOC family protein [Acidimicrobiales bacterium]
MSADDAAHAGAPVTGLSHVQLMVSDVGVSADWYGAALGLEPYVDDRDNGYIALRHRGARIVVVLSADSDAPGSGGPGSPTGTGPAPAAPGRLDHLAFAVPDEDALRSWADHLTQIGIDHAGVVRELGNPSLQLRDPDGIAIELVAPDRPV